MEARSRRALKWIIVGLLGIVGLATLTASDANAHPEHLYPDDGVMTVELAKHRSAWLTLRAFLDELILANGPYAEPATATSARDLVVRPTRSTPDRPAQSPLAPVEIRALVVTYFPPSQVDNALIVIACESRFNPSARNGSHIGLFQIAGFWWRSFNLDPYDPLLNVYMGWQIWLQGHPRAGDGPNWGHWVCQPSGGYWYF